MLVKAHDAPAFKFRAAAFRVRLLEHANGNANLIHRQPDLFGNGSRMDVYLSMLVAVRQKVREDQQAVSIAPQRALVDAGE
jgi:hypothetical protein